MKKVLDIILAVLLFVFVAYLHITLLTIGSVFLIYGLSQLSPYLFYIGLGAYFILMSILSRPN